MAQDIKNRRGNLVISIPDGVVLMPPDPTVSSDGPTLTNPNTSLFQVGRDVLDYGLEISENLHWLMENFANSIPPQNPVDGQLWWDLSNSATPVMRAYNTSTGGWNLLVRLISDSNPTLSANMNASGRRITNLSAPTSAQDAATKQYVDTLFSSVSSGASAFTQLTDTPTTYSGQAGKVVRVNASNTGLEFYKLNFTDLGGVTSNFTGQGGKYLRVNTAATSLEYITPNITHIDWSGAVSINAQGTRITNIASPAAAQDAATKQYVDSTAASIIAAALPSSDGIVVKTGGSAQARAVVSGNDGIIVGNGNGVGGNITLSHKATGAGSSINGGANVIQSISLDAYGHINAIGAIPITNALGYVPVNKAGDTMNGNLTLNGGGGQIQLRTNGDIAANRGNNTGVIFLGNAENHYLYFDGNNYQMPSSNLYVNGGLVWTSNNQGSGTGMNADLLDGLDWHSQQDVDFRIVNARTPGTDTTGAIRVLANGSSQQSIIQFTNSDATSQTGFLAVGPDQQLNFNNGRVWTSLNQGPNTGMNADMVDGKHYSDILAAVGGSFGSNGNGYYEIRATGVIEQWGQGTAIDIGRQSAVTSNFPIPFSDMNSINMSVTSKFEDHTATDGNKVSGQAINTSQFQLYSDDANKVVYWRAIGR